MDILTLELFDVTVSQAVLDVNRALEEGPTVPLRVLLRGDDMLRLNVLKVLERHGRTVAEQRVGGRIQLDVGPGEAPTVPPPPAPLPLPAPPPVVAPAGVAPVLLLRSALGPGDAMLGRRLLLGVLAQLPGDTPWLTLGMEALDLLEDGQALQVLRALQGRGIGVRVSSDSLLFLGGSVGDFDVIEDAEWQRLLARGALRVL